MQLEQTDIDTSNIRRAPDGGLYYTHPSNTVFYDTFGGVRRAERADRPFVVSLCTGVPDDAVRWCPEPGSPEAQFVETWIEECDAVIESLALAIRWALEGQAGRVARGEVVYEIKNPAGRLPPASTPLPAVAAA